MTDKSSSNDYNNDVKYELIDVDRYLSRIADAAVVETRVPLNQTHRKCMIRTLTGTQDSLDELVLAEKLEIQWQRAVRFCQELLLPLQDLQTIDGAPKFHEGLAHLPHPQCSFSDPTRWFNFMARGREYRGRMELLLQDIAPELVPAYGEATQDIDEMQAILSWLRNSNASSDEVRQHKEAAIKCMELDLPPQYCSSSSSTLLNGKETGRQTELGLFTFLRRQRANSGSLMILENVFVKSHVKPNAKQQSGALIICKSLGEGATSEFDSMVVERVDDDVARIVEVWEAKASINPITLHDVTAKKVSSLAAILEDGSARLLLDEKSLRLSGDMPLVVGVFGTSIYPPAAAAQRICTFLAQRMLSTDADVVVSALETGSVTVSRDEVLKKLEELQELAERVRPVIAMSREAALPLG